MLSAFFAVFGDAPQRLELPGLTAVSYYDWEVRDNTAERVEKEIERFHHTLRNADADGWTVHLQHYLIRPKVDFGYPMLYRGADDMLAQLEGARGDHLSLSGHYHFGSEVVRHGAVRFAVCPAVAEAPHPYRVFDLDGDGCRMRQETLVATEPARRALCIDRTGLVTEEPAGPSDAFVFARDVTALFAQVRAQGFEPVLVSAWNDPQSRSRIWSEIMKRHDRGFGSLGTDTDHGAALAICIDEAVPAPARLPSEPLCTYGTLRERVAGALAISQADVYFLSASVDRQARFGGANVFASLDALLEATREPAL